MLFEGESIHLSETQRADLHEIARSQALAARFVLRATIVLLLLAGGVSYEAVNAKLDTTAPTISRWRKRLHAEWIDGIETHRPGQPCTCPIPGRSKSTIHGTS